MAYVYHTVVPNDTVSDLAVTYRSYGATVDKIKEWNHLTKDYDRDVDLIYVGEKLIVGLGGSNPPSTPKPTTTNTVTIEHFGLQAGTDRTVFVAWLWSKDHTKEFEIHWFYQTGDGYSFLGSETTTDYRNSIYTAPSNATSVSVYVKPVSTTYKSNNKDVSYWTGDWSTKQVYYFSNNPPIVPSGLQATLQNGIYTLDLSNLGSTNGTHIEFEIYQGDNTLYKSQTVKIETGHAAFSTSVPDGYSYKAHARGVKNDQKSNWSSWTALTATIPKTPESITQCIAVAPSEVYLEWTPVDGANTYDIEFATEKRYFDGSDSTTIVSSNVSHFNKTGLESGKEYYFRVRAVNSNGNSAWTDLVSIAVGEDPIAPTTWSSTSTAVVGDSVTLNWTHNSKDGSRLTKSKLSLMIGLRSTEIEIVNNDPLTDSGSFNILNIKETGPEITSYLLIRSGPGTTYEEVGRIHPDDIVVITGPKASGTNFVPVFCNGVSGWAYALGNNLVDALSQDTKLRWRVQTKGVTENYGEWSVVRTVTVHARPTNSTQIVNNNMQVISSITAFPFYLKCQAGPSSQEPIGYHVTVVSNTSYDIEDDIGIVKHVYSGDAIYEKSFDISDDLILEFTPGNIALANNASYTFYCTAYMNSGLNAEANVTLTVSWGSVTFAPNAEIGINMDDISAIIRPFCEDLDGNPVTNVLLSVYRRTTDGEFVEIIKDMDAANRSYIADPHPDLDYARYRVVAKSKTTGLINYYDVPSIPVSQPGIVIQWNEMQTPYVDTNADKFEEQPNRGSILKLLYNVDWQESTDPESELVEYIGRRNPVSYYGTQVRQKVSLNTDVPYNDHKTLFALRKLAKWFGDVYVRESSGIGYWARINVSFGYTHTEVIVPVSIEVTRVEGGV